MQILIWILDIIQDLGGDLLYSFIVLSAGDPIEVTKLVFNDILLIAAVITAIVGFFGAIFAVYRWYLHQQEQDEVIKEMKEAQAEEVKVLRQDFTNEISDMKREQQLLVYGMLACLDGLKQLNCNGPVTAAQEKFSNHLNERAHK